MRIIIIHPRVEVRIETWFGLRSVTWARLVSGAWIDDHGRRAGPVLESRLELLGERAEVLMAQEQMVRERGMEVVGG